MVSIQQRLLRLARALKPLQLVRAPDQHRRDNGPIERKRCEVHVEIITRPEPNSIYILAVRFLTLSKDIVMIALPRSSNTRRRNERNIDDGHQQRPGDDTR